MKLFFLIIAQIIWAACASGQTPPALAQRPLTLIPTALEELNELRVNTGRKAVLSDGTMNAVYVKKIPATGSTYLNFHVDVASQSGPFVLHANDILLQRAAATAGTHRVGGRNWKAAPERAASASYTPMDWFIDTGSDEVRGDALTVNNKAIVQFTIEVPRVGFDDLTLFMRSQRIGTVREIRARIAKVGGTE
jgi:hypothetical protein